jgi:hypothetical protein
MKGFFPFGYYSKPLARRVGLESAVILFQLINDYGDNEFPELSAEYVRSLGIETSTWAINKLITEKILIKNSEQQFYRIDYDRIKDVLGDNNSITTKKMSGDCINACKRWITYLKKKGYSKDLGQFLNEVESKDEMDLIYSIQYSIDNGYKSLFFQDSKRVNQRSRINTTGDKTDSDKGRDYSRLVKKAGS